MSQQEHDLPCASPIRQEPLPFLLPEAEHEMPVREGKMPKPPEKKEVKPSKTGTQMVPVQLPLWSEPVRAVPNGFLRSALFGVIAKGKRRYINGESLASIEGVTLRYKGERLDQDDLDVWASVLHTVRMHPLGARTRATTSYALLKMMGKTDTGKNRMLLKARIERLVACAVTLRQGRYTYIGSLLQFAAQDEVTQEWVIEIDEKIAALFSHDQFTRVDWELRRALDGKPLAQWLHCFYSTHAQPYPMKVETLQRLCGSEDKELKSFRQKLRRAFGELEGAYAACGQRFTVAIGDGDTVHVQRPEAIA